MFEIEQIMNAAVDAALAEHESVVRDRHTSRRGVRIKADGDRIEEYYRVPGTGWALGLGDVDYYSEDDGDYWCGAFVAYCYTVVGDHISENFSADIMLNPGLANAMLSTLRLADPDKWREFGAEPPDLVEPDEIIRGDIVVFDTGREDRKVGDHITLAQGPPESGRVLTVEGNANGELGNGEHGEGVVTNRRKASKIARTYRPNLSMFSRARI